MAETINRRFFLKVGAGLATGLQTGCAVIEKRPTTWRRRALSWGACRVVRASVSFENIRYRVPLRFGTGVIENIALATARVSLESPAGRRSGGLGQILLGELWSFPSKTVERSLREKAMRHVAEQTVAWLNAEKPSGHPLEIGWALKSKAKDWCREATAPLALAEPMPLLSSLVSVSPFDAAIHDAFGKSVGRSSYDCYGSDLAPDLSAFLGPGFRGRYVSHYLRRGCVARVPIWHLVGGLDKLRESEIGPDDPKDGLPVSLEKWIERDGVYCIKVKLSGHDVDADIARMRDVYDVVARSLERKGRRRFFLSADSNEQTENVAACVGFLEKLRRDCPLAFEKLLYLEQPTSRDLRARREDMRPVARLKPVLADEAVAELEDLDLAYELGWSGAALKTCKGHTAALFMIAKTVAAGKVYSVQDLTNPAYAYIHSVGLAARSSPLMGVEANARQFIPAASRELAERFPRLFTLRGGEVATGEIQPPGLGY
jgi:L-alanine-DL-glutamate epimerase-like enolase superfamily enzyme